MKLTRGVRAALAAAGVDVPAPRTGDGRPPVPERLFQIAVVEYATLHGWTVYHVPDSRRATAAGFPDGVAMHPTGPVPLIAFELKTERGRVRESQAVWMEAFRRAGVPCYLWRPTSWPEIQGVLGRKR